jgi:3-oxoacyl-[acyl-carrier protein] reductase
MLLRDKVAVVTGSANGIGHAIARLFAENSCRLLLLDRDAENNQRTAMELRSAGVRVLDLALDLRDRPAIEAAVRAAHDQLGPIDILVNNAGIYPRRSFLEISQQQWNEVQSTNLSSMFHMTQVMLPDMISRRSGKVINISSVTFHQGVAGFAHYVASKGGVIGLTRALAREIGPYNVHVNCITPGAVETKAEKSLVSNEQIEAWLSSQSLKRRILPVDIARVCLFLASELSDGMTGQILNVDGGRVMH